MIIHGLLTTLLTAGLIVAPGDTPSAGGPSSVPEVGVSPSIVPPRPHYIAGYTPHALERMALRHVSREEVEAVVVSPNPGIFQDRNNTWMVNAPYITVIINKNAWVVTVITCAC